MIAVRRLLPMAMAALTLVVFATAGDALAAGGGHGGHGAPHVNWWTWDMNAPPVGWFLVDFVLFVWGIVYFARRPVVKAFLDRHLRIKREIEEAESRFTGAKTQFDTYRDKLAHVEEEMSELVERGRENGETEREKIVEGGVEFAERLRRDAKTIVAQELGRTEGRLRAETASRALRIAEQKLAEGLSPDEQKRLLEEAIVDLERGAAAGGLR